MAKHVASATALVLVLAMLAGCGVKGPLEPPPGETPAPATSGPRPTETPHEPTILDGLL